MIQLVIVSFLSFMVVYLAVGGFAIRFYGRRGDGLEFFGALWPLGLFLGLTSESLKSRIGAWLGLIFIVLMWAFLTFIFLLVTGAKIL